jgi:DNA end-binding protein Ku
MPPRAIWTGSIRFGLVNVPVRMYAAVAEHTLHFHFVHEKDGSRIGYEKVCKKEGKPVPDEEIVRAFEYRKGELVTLRDGDFEAAKAEGGRTIEIKDFVPYEAIDPIYFRHTYALGPESGSEKIYALLRRAMEDSGLAAIAKFVMRDRQHLACLRVRDGVITLEQMYFADEIRDLAEIGPPEAKVERKELEMAAQLVEAYSGHFEPEKYKDTYRDALCEIIERKRKGEEIVVEEPEKEEEPADLFAALQASIEALGRNGDGDGLSDLSREELYERAKKADIPGRSQMSKEELVEALSSGR